MVMLFYMFLSVLSWLDRLKVTFLLKSIIKTGMISNENNLFHICPDKIEEEDFMKKGFFKYLILIISAILIFCNVCFADIFSIFPKIKAREVDSYLRFSISLKDASKLIEDLYPSGFFEALGPMSSDLGLDSLVKVNDVLKALSKSNIREFSYMIVTNDEKLESFDGGMVLSVPDGKMILDDAVASGELTLFDLMLSVGGWPLIDAMKTFDDSLEDYKYERDSDGVFCYMDNYVCIEGDTIIVFATREETLSVAKAVRSDETVAADFESPNVFLMHIPKRIAKTPEDIKAEISVSYENLTWKIKTISNIFGLISGISDINRETLEKAQNVFEAIPMVGKGEPFFISGGSTLIEDANSIEERLMNIGDMILTLNWAALLQIAQQYGISKKDVGNLFAGSAAVVFGLDTKLFEIQLPLGGYIAFTGKNGAANKIISAITGSMAESRTMIESKVDGWDNVYSVSIDPMLPRALIAQEGETLLFGVMNSEDLKTRFDIKESGFTNQKMISWLILSSEKIWKSARKACAPLSIMLFSGFFGSITDSEKEVIQYTQQLLNTDFPINVLYLWALSLEEVDINIVLNPSPKGDFWKVFFKWLVMVMDV
jgi:hypothetical protein